MLGAKIAVYSKGGNEKKHSYCYDFVKIRKYCDILVNDVNQFIWTKLEMFSIAYF